MKIDEIRELIRALDESSLDSLEYSEEGMSLRLRRSAASELEYAPALTRETEQQELKIRQACKMAVLVHRLWAAVACRQAPGMRELQERMRAALTRSSHLPLLAPSILLLHLTRRPMSALETA